MRNLKHNYWFKSGFFTIGQRLSVPFFGVGSFLILIRTLSEEEMGAWALFLNIITIFEVARNGLIKGAIIRYFNGFREEQESIKASSFVVNTIYTVLSTGLLLLIANHTATWLNTPALENMLYLYSINALLMLPFSHFEYVQQSNMNFKGVFYSYFAKQGIFFLLVLVWSFFVSDILNPWFLVLFQSLAILLATIISLRFTLPFLNKSFKVSKKWVSKLWDFGKYGFYTNLSNSGLTSTDHFLIGGIVSTASVAIYNASARITNIFILPSVAIADILYPKSVAALTENGTEEVKDLYEKAVGATLVPMLPVMIIIFLFPEPLINILAGEKYIEAAPILQIAILGILILPFLKQFGTIMNTIDKPHYNFYFVLTLAILNLLSNYLLIHQFGIIGAAYGTFFSYFIGFIMSQLILKKLINSSILTVFKNTLFFYRKAFQIIKSKIN